MLFVASSFCVLVDARVFTVADVDLRVVLLVLVGARRADAEQAREAEAPDGPRGKC